MSKKHFSWLVAVTVVAALVAFLLPRETARNGTFEPTRLMPGLEAQANDIDWLQVSTGGETLATLRRVDGVWIVEEANGYRADWPQLQQLLAGLAAAEVVEPKTANPAYYDRLGVGDPAAGTPGVLLAFRESTGLPMVIVGNRAQGREGRYLRLAGSAQSVLIDRELEVPSTLDGWLDRRVVDIARDEVVEVAIRHADGETVVAKKVSAEDEHFELQDVAEGFGPRSEWTVDSLADGLVAVDLDAVKPASEIDWSGAALYRLVTADGLDLAARTVSVAGETGDEEADWLALEAGVYTTALGQETGAGLAAEAAERAAALNDRVSGWAYRIPGRLFDTMNKRMADLVQEVAPEE
jgi:hypothetical protein